MSAPCSRAAGSGSTHSTGGALAFFAHSCPALHSVPTTARAAAAAAGEGRYPPLGIQGFQGDGAGAAQGCVARAWPAAALLRRAAIPFAPLMVVIFPVAPGATLSWPLGLQGVHEWRPGSHRPQPEVVKRTRATAASNDARLNGAPVCVRRGGQSTPTRTNDWRKVRS